MSGPNQMLERLIRIDNRTDSMQHNLAWLVRANEPQLKETLLDAFGTSIRRVQVYLALDGSRSVNDVAAVLKMQRQNVSIELTWLKKRGLIDATEADGRGTIYQKTIFDSIIRLSEALQQKFSLDKNGHPMKKKKK